MGTLRLASFVWAAAFLPASVAHAVEAPDSLTRARMQTVADSSGQVRVTTRRGGIIEAGRPRFEPGGLVLASGRPALVTVGDPRSFDRRIAWSDLERVELERSNLGTPTLVGFALGAAAGVALLAAHGPDGFEKGDAFMILVAFSTTMAGTLGGLLVGMTHPHVTPLYP